MNPETLKSLLWWVLIGLGFFWLMRRGGCGGMAHGHGRHTGSSTDEHGSGHSASGKPIDPVCGMEVDPATAAGTRLVDGHTFFLCSPKCLEAFDRNPAAYSHPSQAEEGHHGRHAGC